MIVRNPKPKLAAQTTRLLTSALLVTVLLCLAVEKTFAINYFYDSLNRLTNVDYGNGSVISYTYDPAGNRLAYTGVAASNSITSTNIVFADDFSGNSLDSTKWTISGSTVIETNQMMEVLTTVTDGGGSLTSLPFQIDPTGKITITRQAFLHYANDYFIGAFLMKVDGQPWFGVDYANMDYSDGVTYMPCHGFYLIRNGTRADIIQGQSDISTPITPLWDTWFAEEVTYDPTTGVMEYFVNGVSQLTFNVGILPPTSPSTMTLSFNAWGWYTGHEQLFEDLVVAQTASTSPEPEQSTAANLGNGVFRVTLNGPAGGYYIVQASSDLVNWTLVATNTILANGTAILDFPISTNQSWFYRCVSPPQGQ